jgi:hypothetical protein
MSLPAFLTTPLGHDIAAAVSAVIGALTIEHAA